MRFMLAVDWGQEVEADAYGRCSPDGSMVVSVLQEAFVRSMMSLCVVWLGGGVFLCIRHLSSASVFLLVGGSLGGCVFQKGGK